MVLIGQRAPFQLGVVIPLALLSQFTAHEQQLLARVRPHKPEIQS